MPEKTFYLDGARIWAKQHPNKITIHIALNKNLISTVENVPGSKRYHPHLFSKLRTILQENRKWPRLKLRQHVI